MRKLFTAAALLAAFAVHAGSITLTLDADQLVAGPAGPQGAQGIPGPAGSGGIGQPLFFRSDAETSPYVLITDGYTTNWATAYSVSVGPLKAGDILSVNVDGQLRNENGFNAEMVSSTVLTPANIPNNADLITGAYYVTKPNGENVNNSPRHYIRLSKGAHYRVVADMPVAYVMARVRSRSSTPGSGNVLDIMQGYGFISVLRFPAP